MTQLVMESSDGAPDREPERVLSGAGSVSRASRLLGVAAWSSLVVYLLYQGWLHYADAVERGAASLNALGVDTAVDSFGACWRAAARMHAGADAGSVYFVAGTRTEVPSLHPPAFHSFFQLFLPIGPVAGAVVWWCFSAACLMGSLPLASGLIRRAAGTEKALLDDLAPLVTASGSPWLGRFCFVLLLPFVQLAADRNDATFVEMYFVLLALVALPERPLRGGAAISVAVVIDPMIGVLLPLLYWKRALRALASAVGCLSMAFGLVVLDIGIVECLHQHHQWCAALLSDPSLEGYHERFQGLPAFLLATVVPIYEEQVGTATGATWDGIRNFLGSERLAANAGLLVGTVLGGIAAASAFVVRWQPRPDTARRWLLEVSFVLCAMLLISPATEKASYWFLLPAMLAAVAEWREPFRGAWARAFIAIVLATQTLPLQTLPKPLLDFFQIFHGFAIGAAGLWALVFVRLWRARSEPDG